jgi:hypothetical protein
MTDFLYAEIKDGIVNNIIKGADSHAFGIISMMLPDSLIVEIKEGMGDAVIGGEFLNGVFRPIRQYPSWVWNGAENRWVAPVPHPGGNVYWDEESKNWEAIPTP